MKTALIPPDLTLCCNPAPNQWYIVFGRFFVNTYLTIIPRVSETSSWQLLISKIQLVDNKISRKKKQQNKTI